MERLADDIVMIAGCHPRRSPPMPPTYTSRPLSILIVDDEFFSWRALGDLLESDGHYVFPANSGATALDLFTQGHWDVVLLDRRMPRMSGEELSSQLKLLSPQTPVIMITGEPPDHCPPGIDEVVEKPIRRETIAHAITRSLAGRRMAA